MALKRRTEITPIDIVKKEVGKPTSLNNHSAILSGSTILDFLLNDKTEEGGYQRGSVINIAGSSQSGKSILAMTIAAECKHKNNGYKVIVNETEFTRNFDLKGLFNLDENDIEWTNSATTEDFFIDVLRRAKKNDRFVYILDSLDGLASKEEKARMDSLVNDTKASGSMGSEKAKSMSQNLRYLAEAMDKTESICILTSQLREKVGVLYGEKETIAGGRALYFWSTHQLWLSIAEKIVESKMQIGVYVKCRLKKNKITGKVRECFFPIYSDYGIDDIGSMVDFLIEMKEIDVRNCFGINARGADDLIKKIEEEGKVKELRELTRGVLKKREDSVALNRKSKYGD